MVLIGARLEEGLCDSLGHDAGDAVLSLLGLDHLFYILCFELSFFAVLCGFTDHFVLFLLMLEEYLMQIRTSI